MWIQLLAGRKWESLRSSRRRYEGWLKLVHGRLPDQEPFQPVGTLNYPNDFEFTRITEVKPPVGTRASRYFDCA